MRIEGARILIYSLLLLSFIGTSYSKRTEKAKRSTLSRINNLINEQINKNLPQFDAPSLPPPQINKNAKKHLDELSVNDPEDFFQGDVELSDPQASAIEADLLQQLGRGNSRRKRKVGRESVYKRWDSRRPISFEFADSIPSETRKRIKEALDLWERNTCLRFLENGPDVDRLEFYDGGGCSSFVGRTGGTQGISISTPGCDVPGIIAHEVGHALGIFHEQARPDQERNIRIHYDNIPVSRWNNFYPVGLDQADVLGLPYDAGSVMHYGASGFAVNPYQATISTLDSQLQQTIGQRVGPSFLDIQAINKAYKCYDHCPRLTCFNGGYPNPRNCNKCKCPTGLGGVHCNEVQFSVCGGKLMASTKKLQIESPNHPLHFNQGMDCNWLIQAPKGGKIFVQFIDSFDYECVETCDRSYLELKLKKDPRMTGYRYCCNQPPQQTMISESNQIIVMHRALGDVSIGFRAWVWSDKDPSVEVVTPTRKKTTTPSQPVFSTGSPHLFTTPSPPIFTTTSRPIFTLPTLVTTTTETTTTTTTITTTTTSARPTERVIEAIYTTTTQPPTTTKNYTSSTTIIDTTVPPTNPYVLPGEFNKFLGGALEPYNSIEVGSENNNNGEEETEYTLLPKLPTLLPTIPMLTTTTIAPAGGPDVEEVTPPDANECACGPWSEWIGTCSQVCGGCGKRSRMRPCRADNCRKEEIRTCNFEVCPKGTNFLWNNGQFHLLIDGCCFGSFNTNGQCSGLEQDKGGVLQLLLNLFKAGDEMNSIRSKGRPFIPD